MAAIVSSVVKNGHDHTQPYGGMMASLLDIALNCTRIFQVCRHIFRFDQIISKNNTR